MPENQSSLQQAMSRIMGAPAGGAPQTAGTAQQASDVALAPRTPYSQELETATPTTQLSISNTPFDPYAEQAAQLAAMQAQTAALQSQIAGGTTGTTGTAAAAAAPAAVAAAPKRLSYTEYYRGTPEEEAAMKKLGYGFWQEDTDLGVGVNWGATGNPYQYRNEYNTYLGTLADPNAYAMNEEVNIAKAALGRGPSSMNAEVESPLGNRTPLVASAPTASKVALTKPVNPGPRAPWQASAQYWKDLETYKRAGGV